MVEKLAGTGNPGSTPNQIKNAIVDKLLQKVSFNELNSEVVASR